MKKHFSVLMLICRSSIYPMLGLLAAVAAAQAGAFLLAAGMTQGVIPPELIVKNGRLSLLFAAGFLALCALLASFGLEGSARQRYTLRRLRVGERAVFAWQAAYNAACFLLYWATGALTAAGLTALYLKGCPADEVTTQSFFLTFFRSDYLHSLLPLQDWPRLVRNMSFAAALGLSTAYVPYGRARGGRGANAIALISIVTVAFVRGAGEYTADLFYSLFALALGAWCVFAVCDNYGDDERERKEATAHESADTQAS